MLLLFHFSTAVKEAHLSSSTHSGKSKKDKTGDSDSDDDEMDRVNDATYFMTIFLQIIFHHKHRINLFQEGK